MEILFTILIYAGIIQGFYMAFLLNYNKRHNVANMYLAVLLVVMSISIAHTTFGIPELHKMPANPYRIREPFFMLVIPLIWLYVKKLEQPLFRFSILTSLHFLPFLIFMSVSIPVYIHGSGLLPTLFLVEHSRLFNGIIWTVLLTQYSAYLYQIVKLTRSYKLQAEQELSNIEHVDISWLNSFLYAYLLVYALLALMFVAALHAIEMFWMKQTISLTFSLTIFILGFKGIFQKSIFSNTESFEITIPIQALGSKQRFVDDELKNRLLIYMDTDKPYCDPELTLTGLAKQLSMSRNQLSELINSSVGCNFYDFVNKYRVEEVKQMLTLSSNKDYTLLAIAFDAGFPSKSTFNSIFKKITGLTPSAYRNGLQ